MPCAARRSTRSTSSRIRATSVQLGLHVGSGTYVRSIARRSAATADAAADRGRARSRSRRPTRSGSLPVSEALGRLPEEALERVPYGLRAQVLAFEAETAGSPVLPAVDATERRVNVARDPGRARAPAAGGRDRHVRRRPPRPSGASCARRSRPGSRRPSSPSTRIRGRCSATASSCSRRSSGGSSCSRSSGSRRRSSSSSRPRSRRSSAEAFAQRTCSRSAPSSSSPARVPLRARPERRPRRVRAARSRGPRGAARPGRLVDADPPARRREGDVRGAAALLGRPVEVEGIVVSGDARGGTLGFPTANLRVDRSLLVPRFGIYAGAGARPPGGDLDRRQPALRRRGAPDRGVPARLRGRPLRASGSSSSSGSGSATRPCSRARPSCRADRARRRGDARGDAALSGAWARAAPSWSCATRRRLAAVARPPPRDSPGVWLVLAKKSVEAPTSLRHQEALEEALCHGWIDGQPRGARRADLPAALHAAPRAQRVVEAEHVDDRRAR